jgi:hypothetical protein
MSGSRTLKKPSPRFWLLLSAFCLCLLLAGFYLVSCGGVTQSPKAVPTKATVPPLPTPGPARTIYTNIPFGYTIRYPSQWPLIPSSNNSSIRVFMKHDLSVPEAAAFDITCASNPNQLDAQTFWHQTRSPNSTETGTGLLRFSSGAMAYVAKGQGQTPYQVYTLVNQTVACQIVTSQTDPANAHVVLAVINSFHWQ